jgi:L-amino acid N-acyltransferase YncA
MIRDATLNDAAKIVDIYNHYISDSVVTFEQETISADIMQERIGKVLDSKLPWLVAEQDSNIIGYCYATPWKERSAYRFSVEATVYLLPQVKGRGWGSQLYQSLFEQLKHKQIHAVMGGITLPNEASIKLHEKFGMNKVAHFKQVGYKFKQWLDVGYWQKIL